MVDFLSEMALIRCASPLPCSMKTIKVAIDISPLQTAHRFRGIGTYTKNLVEALQKYRSADLKVELIENGRVSEEVDLVHYPYFDLFRQTLPLVKKKKTIVTIHDVIPLVFSQHYPPGLKGKLILRAQKLALKTVQAVICDSRVSKKDIFNYLCFPLKKIFVVWLAPGEKFRVVNERRLLSGARRKYHLPRFFVLYTGDVNYNKNILGLVKACKSIKLPLVVVGKQAAKRKFDRAHIENRPLVQLIELYGDDPEVVRLGFVPDEDLVVIYNLATVYCQPSFYEGFGLPVLEAMTCGCPVVAAKTSSLPEICGNAAVLVNPYSITSIAKGIKKATKNKKELVKKGFQQVRRFSWGKVANETYEIYERVVKG